MTVTHIVSFRFKDSVSKEEREKVHKDFLHLKDSCKRQDSVGDEMKYIINLVGGKANSSTEGAGKDFDVRIAFHLYCLFTHADLFPHSTAM